MKIKKNTKIIVTIVLVISIILIFSLILLISNSKSNKDNDLDLLKTSISKVFFNLPNNEYESMNDISDYCKVIMVFDTEYLKNYTSYNYNLKNKKAYSIRALNDAVKNILGNNTSISLNPNEEGNYDFVNADSCQFTNDGLLNISYDSEKKLVYNISNEKNIRKIYVKWTNEYKEGNDIILYAQALMSVESDLGYDLYSDYNMMNLIGHYKSKSQLEKELNQNYVSSYNYEFHIRVENNKYIWKSFVRNNVDEIIVE